MVDVTKYGDPKKIIGTVQYGRVTYGDWLELEAQRINKNPKRHTEIQVETTNGRRLCRLVDTNYNDINELMKDYSII